ncbi:MULTISPECIES: PspC domain-containing protein [unclassified Cryobacterium]|uniref:PspC domain-containing protein n=1 Tax=unclassified Cryobacterium TaxID=2649013 RepID=UPI002AB4BB01|nr:MULTISPECIES: PspC domain-containing protein [unclassified Cryobacterium]MDY7541711.1 PspC domain-containing protein [Cryobacterium sp. 5B3]MEA9999620.1 PspC domain-containing protein [Cryobacterium sp. RTS3]MEB0266440.1 PspC domain-containing protein [Cryobacterium sp. 10I5]MEB0275435.1 PspC domain-containing protein [Cryobacterium sp. 5B3]
MTDQPRNPTYPAGPGPSGPDQLTRFFDWIRRSGMVRGADRWFAGVCGAIAGRTGLDPMIVRGIAFVLAVLGAPVLFVYAVGWALLPNALGRIHAEEALRGRFEPAMIGIGAVLLLTIVPFTRGFWWDGPPAAWGMPGWLSTSLSAAWGLAVLAGIVWLVLYLVRRGPGGGSGGGNSGGYGSGGGSGYSPGPGSGSGSGERPRPTSGYGSAADAGATPPAPGAPPAPLAPPAPGGTTSAGTAGPAASAGFNAPTGSASTSGPAAAAGFAPQSSWTASPSATENPYQADYRNRNGIPPAAPGTYPAASAYPGGPGTPATAAYAANAASATAANQAWQEQNRVRSEQNRAWREQNLDWQERQRQRQAERSAWRRGRRPSAALSAIALGFALLAGAIVAFLYAHGVWSNSAFVLGLAVALGVAAIGMIVSGIRGRESGALGGLAFLAALTLVALGWMPQGTQFAFAGTHDWAVPSSSAGAPPGYAMFAGTPTVDLTALDNAPARDARTIDVWLGFGVTTLELPSDRPVEVEVNLLAGIVTTGGESRDPQRAGVFIRDVRTVNGTDARAVTHVRVWSFAGQVDLTQSGARVGTAR